MRQQTPLTPRQRPTPDPLRARRVQKQISSSSNPQSLRRHRRRLVRQRREPHRRRSAPAHVLPQGHRLARRPRRRVRRETNLLNAPDENRGDPKTKMTCPFIFPKGSQGALCLGSRGDRLSKMVPMEAYGRALFSEPGEGEYEAGEPQRARPHCADRRAPSGSPSISCAPVPLTPRRRSPVQWEQV